MAKTAKLGLGGISFGKWFEELFPTGEIFDFTGKYFGNGIEGFCYMCSTYGQEPKTVEGRIRVRGKNLEQALTVKKQDRYNSIYDPVRDEMFPSLKAFCRAHKSDVSTYNRAIKKGLSHEDAILHMDKLAQKREGKNLKLNEKKLYQDLEGDVLLTANEAVDKYNLASKDLFYKRYDSYRNGKITLEQVYKMPCKKVQAYVRKDDGTFETLIDACNRAGVSYMQINYERTKSEEIKSFEEIIPVVEKKKKSKKADKNGEIENIENIVEKQLKKNGCDVIKDMPMNAIIDDQIFNETPFGDMEPSFTVNIGDDFIGFVEIDNKKDFKNKNDDYKIILLQNKIEDFYCESRNIPLLRVRDDQVDEVKQLVKKFVKNPEEFIDKHNSLKDRKYYRIEGKEARIFYNAICGASAADEKSKRRLMYILEGLA